MNNSDLNAKSSLQDLILLPNAEISVFLVRAESGKLTLQKHSVSKRAEVNTAQDSLILQN